MMVRLWNDNTYPHKEMYNGDLYEIPSKGFAVMEKEDAVGLRGQYFTYFKDAGGLQDPRSYKMLRIEEIPIEELAKEVEIKKGKKPAA